MTTIRDVEDDDVAAVLGYISANVARSVYAAVLPRPGTHDWQLMTAARSRGVALAAFEGGVVVGTLIAPIHDYMGRTIAEEVAWFADDTRDLLRLFAHAERQAVQKGADVLKMSAPVGTDLGEFYLRHGYQPLEAVFVKVLDYGMGSDRNRSGRPHRGRAVRLREEEERAG